MQTFNDLRTNASILRTCFNFGIEVQPVPLTNLEQTLRDLHNSKIDNAYELVIKELYIDLIHAAIAANQKFEALGKQ